MCGAIVALNVLMTVLAVLKNHWFPLAAFETGVDPVGFSLNLGLEISISLDAATSGRTYLDEGELLLVSRVSLKKQLDRLEALDDPLGVVQAIDTQAKEGCFAPQLTDQRTAFLFHSFSGIDACSRTF